MVANHTLSHTGADGSSPGDRMTAAGYQFTGSWTWGENVAMRSGSGAGIDQANVDAMHASLFQSSGHRANILNGDFKEIGIGLAADSGSVYATEAFAKSGTQSFLTGVAFDDRDGDNFYDPGEGSTILARAWAASRSRPRRAMARFTRRPPGMPAATRSPCPRAAIRSPSRAAAWRRP
ncbi:MAG: CAP domain-containing protein [Acetobacteraceae bacterium]|nr:CAP domain-containing protein [Acetobacteraceae bacterium]